jgi:hypothetical protein
VTPVIILAILMINVGLTAAIRRELTVIGSVAEILAFGAFLATAAALIGTLSFISSGLAWASASLVTFFTVILYVASLNFLQVTGYCLDISSLRMVLVNTRLGILHEASYQPVRAAASAAVMIVATITIAWFVGSLIGATVPRPMPTVIWALLAISACLAFGALATLASLDSCRRGGPFSCLLADFLAAKRFSALQPRNGDTQAPVLRIELSSERKKDLVLLVIVDSFRTNLLGDNVVSQRWMPQLFQRSTTGSLFNNHRCNAVMSEFSDISLLAGDLRWRSFFHGMPSPGSGNQTLHQWFSKAGYTTAHISAQDERWSRMHRWYERDVDHMLHAGGGNLDRKSKTDLKDGRILAGAKLKDEIVLKAAQHLIQNRKEPIFMTINLQSTHVPFFYDQTPGLPWPDIDPATNIRFGGLDDAMIEVARMKYANALFHVDRLLAGLIDSIARELGDRSATLWITGDTGQAFGEHGYSGHGAGLHDELLHTPLIVFGDDRFEHATSSNTHHLQIYGTLSSYADANARQHLCTLERPSQAIPLVCQTPMANELGILSGNDKFVMNCRNLQVTKFDLQNDPDELNGTLLSEAEARYAQKKILTEVRQSVANATSIAWAALPHQVTPTHGPRATNLP